MATLKNKKAKTKEVEQEVAPVEEPVNVEYVEEPIMTEDEKEAVKKAEELKELEGADTQRLRLATNVVSSKFNLDPTYRVSKFDDKGKVVNLTLENKDFTISVTIKDSERHGMIVE